MNTNTEHLHSTNHNDHDNNNTNNNINSSNAIDPDSTINEVPLTNEELLEDRIIDTLNLLKVPQSSNHVSSGSNNSNTTTTADVLIQSLLELTLFSKGNKDSSAAGVGAGVGEAEEDLDSIRLQEELCWPTILEIAQSDIRSSQRTAALSFFHKYYQIITSSTTSKQVPYSILNHTQKLHQFLHYWLQACIGCLVHGTYTQSQAEQAVHTRGILSANAVIRPVFRAMAQCIAIADDAGAMYLFQPCMQMIGAVCEILLRSSSSSDSNSSNSSQAQDVRAGCMKVLETIVLCCTMKDERSHHHRRQRVGQTRNVTDEEVSLNDIPNGHPVITRDVLELIGHYAFVILRGVVEVGGQVASSSVMIVEEKKQDEFVDKLIQIIKPAALAFLEVDQNRLSEDKLDRKNLDITFYLSQKSYAIAINAIAIIAINRVSCFKDAATALARRAMDPLVAGGEEGSTKAAALGVNSQLRASCLTLLRNPSSVTTKGSEILTAALNAAGMTVQAEKALTVAKQQAALKTASRKVRNRAAVFYEWDQSEQEKTSKRQRETNDELAKLRAAKVARGLGNGIHLPVNLIETCELVLLNLQHIPASRPSQMKKSRDMINLDYIVDAIMSSGESLRRDAARWYDRDGGEAWSLEMDESPMTDELDAVAKFELSDKALIEESGRELFAKQCKQAAADAFSRVVSFDHLDQDMSSNPALSSLRKQLCARLSWTMKGVAPSTKQSLLYTAHALAIESTNSIAKIIGSNKQVEITQLVKEYPLVAACLALEYAMPPSNNLLSSESDDSTSSSLMKQVILEAHLGDTLNESNTNGHSYSDAATDVFFSIISHVSESANNKPTDLMLKKVASTAQKTFPYVLEGVPAVSERTLRLLCTLCDIDAVHKNLADITRKSSSTIAASAAAHAASAAAEKRATTTLLALRDIAFQRTKKTTRQAAVSSAVSLATGRFPSTTSVQDKALKLVMNLLFPKSPVLADMVVASATTELQWAADFAIENFERVETARKSMANSNPTSASSTKPVEISEEESQVISKIKPIAEVYMALCVRRPDAIRTLMECSCRPKATILLDTVKHDISRMARALGTAYDTASIALKVSQMASSAELPILFAFLDNLSPRSHSVEPPTQALVDACFQIQKEKSENGKLDPRFIIPIVSAIPRSQLIDYLPKFIEIDDDIYKAALLRMSERLGRENLLFREHDSTQDELILKGMTRCEQIVYLHKLDFKAVGLPQKRYLDAIKLCLEMEDVFTDRVLHASLDYISQQFLLGKTTLPLAYMRTIIIVCQRHETLHNWFCSELLSRLVDGKIYNDRRQWEGWMRTARMLEKNIGVNSLEAIAKLPEAQLQMYRSKYPA